jgi:putative two-component system response regulator
MRRRAQPVRYLFCVGRSAAFLERAAPPLKQHQPAADITGVTIDRAVNLEAVAAVELGRMRVLLISRDEAARRFLTTSLTRAGYADVLEVEDPERASSLCRAKRPDVVILALDTQELRDVLEQIHDLLEAPESLPVLALWAQSDPLDRRTAILRGVRDVAALPIDDAELLLRVGNLLRTRQLEAQLSDRNAMLTETILLRRAGIDTTRESLSVLAAIADYHDDDTSQHAERVGILAAQIAEALGESELFVTMMRDAAPLHDIGKVGISRRILLKPDELTAPEWEHMMRHVEIGAQILSPARSAVLQLAGEIARTHHERWDGSGYLAGLAGEEIPLSGRITALADVWDTLTRERPYRAAWDHERARTEIRGQAGLHFDPRIVRAFDSIEP